MIRKIIRISNIDLAPCTVIPFTMPLKPNYAFTSAKIDESLLWHLQYRQKSLTKRNGKNDGEKYGKHAFLGKCIDYLFLKEKKKN